MVTARYRQLAILVLSMQVLLWNLIVFLSGFVFALEVVSRLVRK